MIKRIIVLGHSGFVGRNLTEYCRKNNPHTEVLGFSAPQTDLTKPAQAQKISTYFTKYSAIVMLSGIKPNIGDTLETFSQNVSMMINLCHVLQKHPVARFVYMSSAAVYGEDIHNTNISEETPVQPRSYYGLAKYTSEQLLVKVYDEQKRKGLVILRPPVIYGPGEKVVSYDPAGLLQTAQKGNAITLWGDGSEKREFIYIDDIIKLIYYFIFHPYDGVINIASGTSYSFQETIAVMEKLLGKPIVVRTKKRSKEKVDHKFNNRLLREILPDFRFTTLTEGLSKIIRS